MDHPLTLNIHLSKAIRQECIRWFSIREISTNHRRHKTMKSRSYFQCWLVILVLTWCASVESSKRLHNLNSEIFKDDEQLSSDSSKEDVLIEDNPDFVKAATREDDGNDGDDGSGSDSDGDDDNDDDDINDNNENAARSSLNSELKKAKERSRCVINLVKKNRSRTIAALTVFAFRKEILQLIIYFAKSQIPRTKTTSILKLLLFVHFMRQLQTGDLSSSTGRWFSAFAGSTPGLGSLLSKYNPANLPPIQQHYSFERYDKIVFLVTSAQSSKVLTTNPC